MGPDFRHAMIDYIRTNAKPVDKFGHQPRLYALAVQVADGHPFDDDIVFAAAWMHDLGVFVGHRPEDVRALGDWDMIAYAVRIVPGLLVDFGFPAKKIPAVLDVIRTHQASKTPCSFEAELVRDADILEQLGAIGVCRTVSKVGRDTRFVRFADAARVLHKNLDELPGKLWLESSRGLAKKRIKILREFLKALEAEAGDCEY